MQAKIFAMIRKTITVLLSAALLVTMAAAMTGTVGGDIGYYQINAGIDGAAVLFDDDYKGVTDADGTLMVEVYTTGTPYTTYRVEKPGYTTYTGKITDYPAKGEIVQISTEIEQQLIGGDKGYYQLTTNADGAAVFFGNDYKGVTEADGTLLVEVYTTGTPYTTYQVVKPGYTTYTGKITDYPAKGEIVQVSAEIEERLIGGDKGYYKLTTNVGGAAVYFGNDYKGVTEEDGTLMIEIYTTGTPYTTYQVEKPGYTTYTGKITNYPAKGEIVSISADLPVTATPTQSPFPLAGLFGLAALGAIVLSRKE
jgi:hypothetical protein